jgi:hypothetical protein
VISNGVTTIEAQVETVADMITELEKQGVRSIEATHEAELEWKAGIEGVFNMTLFPQTSSWWTGANVPGKKAEGIN